MNESLLSLQTSQELSMLIDAAAALKSTLAFVEQRKTKLENDLTIIEDQIFVAMQAQKLTAAAGLLGRAEIKPKRIYKMDAQMWNELHKHIAATGEFDLLTRRLNSTALKEREKVGTALPPGVVAMYLDELNVKELKS